MPVFVLAVPAAAELIGAGLIALCAAIIANRARVAYQAAQAARAAELAAKAAEAAEAQAQAKEKEESAAKAGTTTVVGKKNSIVARTAVTATCKKNPGTTSSIATIFPRRPHCRKRQGI